MTPKKLPFSRDAWSRLGTSVSRCTSAESAMKKAGLLGWHLRKNPLYVYVGDEAYVDVPDQFGLIRDNPRDGIPDVLGVVGIKHTAAQNEELIPLLDGLAEQSGASFHAAGEIDGGRRIFVSLELPGRIKVNDDIVKNYITVLAGRDGQSSTSFLVAPVHQGTATLLNADFDWSAVRTTIDPSDTPETLMQLAFDYLDAFQRDSHGLAMTSMDQTTFESTITSRFGAPAGSPAITRTRYQNKLDQMAMIFSERPDTAWDGFTALARWHDHFSPVRGTDNSPEDARRARKAVLEPSFKRQAHKAMMAFV